MDDGWDSLGLISRETCTRVAKGQWPGNVYVQIVFNESFGYICV